MQTFLIFLILFIIPGGSEEGDDKLQGMWTEKYTVIRSGSGIEKASLINSRKMLYFFEDSVLIKKFPFDFVTPGDYFKSGVYEHYDSEIIIEDGEISETFMIRKLDNDLLILESERDGGYIKMIFQRLHKNDLASKEEEVLEFLTTNNFEITNGDSTGRIKFNKDGTFEVSEFSLKLSDNNLWAMDQFNDELFVLTDGVMGFFMHINSIGKERIDGIIYSKENMKMTFVKKN
jgi:hypothetical protein